MFVRRSGSGNGLLGQGCGPMVFAYVVLLTILPTAAVMMLMWFIREALVFWSDYVLLGLFIVAVLAILTVGIVGVRWARAIERRGVVAPPTYVFAAPNGATTIQMPEVDVTKPMALGPGQSPWQMAQTQQLASSTPEGQSGGFTVRRRN